MYAVFLENGPFRIQRANETEEFKLVSAEKSWVDDYNVVYIDQPVNTGFSYGDSSISDLDVGADEFRQFLLKFYEKYEDMSEKPLILTG